MEITYLQACPENADDLVRIRIEAMKESLQKIGRFDPQRARERFLSSFKPENTKYILLNEIKVGFFVVSYIEDYISLDHLYIEPEYQNKGAGSVTLNLIFSEADSKLLTVRVGALKESASNRFYLNNGFIKIEESEWDIYYIRQPKIKN